MRPGIAPVEAHEPADDGARRETRAPIPPALTPIRFADHLERVNLETTPPRLMVHPPSEARPSEAQDAPGIRVESADRAALRLGGVFETTRERPEYTQRIEAVYHKHVPLPSGMTIDVFA